MKKQQSITSLPQSPDEERRGRVLRYSVAMGVRLVCVILALVLHGWIQVVAIVGAVVLPYFAVVLANVAVRRGGEVIQPGPMPRKEIGQ
jgi:Flp pilus assembly protein TadB